MEIRISDGRTLRIAAFRKEGGINAAIYDASGNHSEYTLHVTPEAPDLLHRYENAVNDGLGRSSCIKIPELNSVYIAGHIVNYIRKTTTNETNG